MKNILLALAISANIFVVFGASTANVHPRRGIEGIVEDKCFENSHNKYAFQALNEAMKNYPRCAGEALSNLTFNPVEQHEEFCSYIKQSGYYKCLQNVALDTLPCLDKTEIFFPHMILKAYNTIFNDLCGTNGLIKTEYIINKLERNDVCLRNVMGIVVYEGRCIANLTALKNYDQNILDLNKHDYCIDMESFVSCATELIEEGCEEDLTLLIENVSKLFLGVCKV